MRPKGPYLFLISSFVIIAYLTNFSISFSRLSSGTRAVVEDGLTRPRDRDTRSGPHNIALRCCTVLHAAKNVIQTMAMFGFGCSLPGSVARLLHGHIVHGQGQGLLLIQ